MWKKVACIHNPATGREAALPQIVETSHRPGRRIVVVGGGPGGLEAARVAAERGHRVTLLEAQSRLGGQLLLATKASWRRDLIAIVDWRQAELERLGVDVRLNTLAEPADVIALSPDAVIVATGGVPDLGWLQGGEHCTTVWDALADPGSVKDDLIVWDGTGRHTAVSAALQFAEQGRKVHLLALDDTIALEMEYSSRVVYRQRLAKNGARITIDQQIVSVERKGNGLVAHFRHELTGELTEFPAAQVIVENGTVPVDDVFQGLAVAAINRGITDLDRLIAREPQLDAPMPNGRFELHRIGDAVTSRGVHSAIYDALRLASAL